MMRREENLRPAVLVTALAAAVLGFALRLWQLRQGRDENGLWLGGSASVLALLALCVIAIVVFWLLSRRAAPRAASGILPPAWPAAWAIWLAAVCWPLAG